MELQYSGRASLSTMEEEDVLERERGVHLHTLVDRERKRSRERG